MVYVSAEVRALLDAVTEGDNQKVKEQLKSGAAVNLEDEDGNTALIFAAEEQPLIVETLIEAGAALDHQNKNGVCALMVAIRCIDIDSIKLLTAAGANLDMTDTQGRGVIDYAQETCDETVLRVLLGMSEGSGPRAKTEPALPVEVMRRGSLPSCTGAGRRVRAFLDAVSEGDMERMQRLFDLGVEVNVCDDVGNYALHFAVEGEPNTVSYLLGKGANAEVANKWGRTPLMAAICYGDAESTSVLLKSGADAAKVDSQGHDALWHAEKSGSTRMVSMVRDALR